MSLQRFLNAIPHDSASEVRDNVGMNFPIFKEAMAERGCDVSVYLWLSTHSDSDAVLRSRLRSSSGLAR